MSRTIVRWHGNCWTKRECACRAFSHQAQNFIPKKFTEKFDKTDRNVSTQNFHLVNKIFRRTWIPADIPLTESDTGPMTSFISGKNRGKSHQFVRHNRRPEITEKLDYVENWICVQFTCLHVVVFSLNYRTGCCQGVTHTKPFFTRRNSSSGLQSTFGHENTRRFTANDERRQITLQANLNFSLSSRDPAHRRVPAPGSREASRQASRQASRVHASDTTAGPARGTKTDHLRPAGTRSRNSARIGYFLCFMNHFIIRPRHRLQVHLLVTRIL